MAEFSPTTFQAPSTGGAGTVQSGSGSGIDFSQSIALAGKIGERIHGKVVAEKAFQNIENAQKEFLDNRNQITEAEGELAILRDQNPREAAIVDKTEKRIKELESFVTTGGISPTVAASRVESLRKQAMNSAPIFAQEIRRFSGARGVAFDTETEQLIKERNDIRDAMVEIGFNPDNPKHAEEYNRSQQLTFKNGLRAQEDIRDERNAEDLLTGVALEHALPVEMKIRNALDGVDNDVSKLDPEVLSGLLFELSQARANTKNTANRLAIENGFTLSSLSDDLIDNVTATFDSNLDYYTQVLNGSLKNTATSNILKTAQNEQLLLIQRNFPGLFNMIALADNAKAGSVGSEALSQQISNELTDAMRLLNLPNYSADMLTAKFRSGTAGDNKALNDDMAAVLKINRQGWVDIKNPSPETLTSHSITLTNLATTMAASPQDTSKDMIEELMASVNSKNLMGHLSTLDDLDAKVLSGSVGDALQVYSHEKLVPDIKSDLSNQSVVVRRGGKRKRGLGAGITVPASEYIQPILTPSGGISFKYIPQPGKIIGAPEARARQQVADMNRKYSNLSTKIVMTSANVSGSGTSAQNRRDQGVFLYQSLFPQEKLSGEE